MTTMYKDVLEGNYVVGGSVHLKDGLIENNPFSKKLGNCLAANWMLKNKKKIGFRLWLKWARQLSSALYHLECLQVVHHDIKPHNILVIFINLIFKSWMTV